jgi:hypothetical protein
MAMDCAPIGFIVYCVYVFFQMLSPSEDRRSNFPARGTSDVTNPASPAARAVPPLSTSLPLAVNTGSYSARGRSSDERLAEEVPAQPATARARLLPVLKTPSARPGADDDIEEGLHMLDKPAWCFRYACLSYEWASLVHETAVCPASGRP